MSTKSSACKVVHIKTDSGEKILSKEQKKFNLLIKKIEKQKKLFKEWDSAVRTFRHEINPENNKTYDEYDKFLTELLRLLDAAYPNKLFTKTDKNKIRHMIFSVVENMMSDDGTEEAITIYNKYNIAIPQVDEQLLDQQVGEMMKSMFEEMLGIKLDEDADVSSPEKFSEELKEKLKQRERLAEEKRSKRKKTAKQMEKEERLKQQEQDVSKSIQGIYRKMVAALHPDLEQDESEKVRKTKIMQEVNAAYAEKNLLRLFELQLELEHIDQDHLGNIAEEKLKLFNKILQSQLKELEQEVSFIERQAKMEIDWIPFFLSPDQFLGKLRQNVENIKKGIVQTKEYIERFASHQELKAFLKTYKIPRQQPQHF
uniref:J domain-containing protein n=1 Tax=Candidatus Electronema sp. TaxID=2698783 RepID=UPI004057699D